MFYVYLNSNNFVFKKEKSETHLSGDNIQKVSEQEYNTIRIGSRLVDNEWQPPKQPIQAQPDQLIILEQEVQKQRADIDYMSIMLGVDLNV